MSSDVSNSRGYNDRGLTPTVLEHHARQAGRPGPPTHPSMRLPRAPQRQLPAVPLPPQQQQYPPYQWGSGAPYARPPVGHGYGYGYQQEYLQPNHERRRSYGSDHTAEVYRECHGDGAQPRAMQGRPGPGPPPGPPDARPKASSHSREGDSSDSDDSQLDREIARPGWAAAGGGGGGAHTSQMASPNQTQYQIPPVPPPPPAAPMGGLSFGSDQYGSLHEEDAAGDHADVFDEESLYSPVSKAIADDFSTLLWVEDDHRGTMDSYRFSVTSSLMGPTISFCDTVNDDSSRDTRGQLLMEEDELVAPSPRKQSQGSADSSGPTASSRTSQSSGSLHALPLGSTSSSSASAKADEKKKVSVVQLYQKILELTKQQHALDTAAPVAELNDKERVARELRELYQRLHELTMNPEIEF